MPSSYQAWRDSDERVDLVGKQAQRVFEMIAEGDDKERKDGYYILGKSGEHVQKIVGEMLRGRERRQGGATPDHDLMFNAALGGAVASKQGLKQGLKQAGVYQAMTAALPAILAGGVAVPAGGEARGSTQVMSKVGRPLAYNPAPRPKMGMGMKAGLGALLAGAYPDAVAGAAKLAGKVMPDQAKLEAMKVLAGSGDDYGLTELESALGNLTSPSKIRKR
jgi:hypothetical protein